MRITGNTPAEARLRRARHVKPPFVRIAFPPATPEQPQWNTGWRSRPFTRSSRASRKTRRYDGFRRDWLNIFQVNPRVQMLANNASSDPCSFTLFEYSDLALHTPPLAEGLTCQDLVRMTLDRYIAGAKGYGQVGYACEPTDADLIPWKTPWTSLDTLPSLLISACNYVNGSGDVKWAASQLRQARRVGPRDVRRRQGRQRPDRVSRHRQLRRPAHRRTGVRRTGGTRINFGHEDAFANALAYRAATMFAELAGKLEHADDAGFSPKRPQNSATPTPRRF